MSNATTTTHSHKPPSQPRHGAELALSRQFHHTQYAKWFWLDQRNDRSFIGNNHSLWRNTFLMVRNDHSFHKERVFLKEQHCSFRNKVVRKRRRRRINIVLLGTRLFQEEEEKERNWRRELIGEKQGKEQPWLFFKEWPFHHGGRSFVSRNALGVVGVDVTC